MINIDKKLGLIILLSLTSKFAIATGFDLAGTVFEEVAQKKNLDPYLLYAISLSESAFGKSGVIAPHRYTIRTADQAYYLDSKSEAETEFMIEMDTELSGMFKTMVGGKLQELVDKVTDQIEIAFLRNI